MLSQTWFAYLQIQQLQSNIIIHLEWCVLPSNESKSDIYSLLAQFLVFIPLYSCRNKIQFARWKTHVDVEINLKKAIFNK